MQLPRLRVFLHLLDLQVLLQKNKRTNGTILPMTVTRASKLQKCN